MRGARVRGFQASARPPTQHVFQAPATSLTARPPHQLPPQLPLPATHPVRAPDNVCICRRGTRNEVPQSLIRDIAAAAASASHTSTSTHSSPRSPAAICTPLGLSRPSQPSAALCRPLHLRGDTHQLLDLLSRPPGCASSRRGGFPSRRLSRRCSPHSCHVPPFFIRRRGCRPHQPVAGPRRRAIWRVFAPPASRPPRLGVTPPPPRPPATPRPPARRRRRPRQHVNVMGPRATHPLLLQPIWLLKWLWRRSTGWAAHGVLCAVVPAGLQVCGKGGRGLSGEDRNAPPGTPNKPLRQRRAAVH
ncbi:hypothetical protein P154DRAFT_218350 [Amniculicola lignicola CBS 123094]|uniref:Uncharacterized protein n=1 Tax=Amniculicola lignicola CBS 123094 TaxID=1392246 RepID=A0A6A5WXM6_9PLEO|nr:hypothetical protein P154DRAFT_218350 [Amniculicola lignicola CBS 123094]